MLIMSFRKPIWKLSSASYCISNKKNGMISSKDECNLENRTISIFKTFSSILVENCESGSPGEKLSTYEHMPSHMPSTKAKLESKLPPRLFEKFPRHNESGAVNRNDIDKCNLLLNEIEKKYSTHEEKREAYKKLVKLFNIDSCEKYEQYRQFHYSEIFAIEAAKYASAKNGARTSEYFEGFNIENESAKIKIAKIAAAQNGRATSGFIGRYEIRDQTALIEIAKIAAIQNGEYTSYFIQKYNIRSQIGRIEIAKISMANDEKAFEFIFHYTISNQDALIEIAKIAAAKNGMLLSKHIQNFRIEDQIALLSIFLIAYANSQGALKYFWKYNFSDELCINSENVKAYLNPLLMNTFELLSQNVADFSKVCESLISFSSFNQWPSLEIFFEKIQQKDPSIQKSIFYWLKLFLGFCSHEKVSYEQFNFLLVNGFLDASLNYADPKMRFQLTSTMIKLVKVEAGKEFASSCLKNKIYSHAKIPLILLSSIYAQGVHRDVCSQQLEIASKSIFRDGKNLRVYVNALHIIMKCEKLNTDDKQNLLKQISLENIMPTLYAIQALSDLKKMHYLRKSNLENTTLSNILQECIQELIPTKKITNFSEQYAKYFNGNRVPNFLLTYAANLRSDMELTKSLGIGLDGILSNSYPEMRYNIQKSVHLKKVFNENSLLFQEWKKGEKAPLGYFLAETDTEIKTFDFLTLLKTNLIDHEHLKSEHAPLLFDFLNQIKTCDDVLREIDRQLHISKDKLILNVQKNCLKLTDKDLTFDDQKLLLKEIESDLKLASVEVSHFIEFQNDIKGLLSGLIKQNVAIESYNKFTIEDTDNLIDLFLSGTEVGGSCLRINGVFNKCLMNYVFDGKNRMLVVKDRNGKIIARHIFRILWNGSEPVIFMERVYPSLIDSKLRKALEAFAIQRAQKLGLPLLVQDSTQPVYEKPIFSLGTMDFIHFEYSDASHTHVTNGKYTVSSSNILYAPHKDHEKGSAEEIQEILDTKKACSE